MSNPELRIDRNRLLRKLHRCLKVASGKSDLCGKRMVCCIQRIQFAGALCCLGRLRRLFAVRENNCQHAVRERVAWIQGDCAQERLFSSGKIPIKPELHLAQRALSLGQFGIGSESMLGCGAGARSHLEWTSIAVDRTRRKRVRNSRPRQSVLWIPPGGARIVLHCAPGGGGRELIPEIAAAQIKVVGVSVLRLPFSQSGQAFG